MTEQKQILVVEDEALLAELLADNLRDGGYEVVGPALDVATALHLLRTERVNAALLDVNLPGGNVDSIADEMAQRGIPFAFCSGGTLNNVAARHANRPVLEKPFTAPAMLALAERLLSSGTRPA